jgi:hypothetical protein
MGPQSLRYSALFDGSTKVSIVMIVPASLVDKAYVGAAIANDDECNRFEI